MIKIDNIVKCYSKKKILDNITFSIDDGESVAIIGGNGAGKTTLLEIIAGINEPTSGKVYFSDTDKNWTDKEEKEFLEKNVGVQFQSGVWPFNTRPIDLLNFFVDKNWKNNEYVKNLIDVFEVENILDKKINKCSGGEQQRFNCLLSIINKPRILILDELITGLDLKMQMKLIKFFKELRIREKITLIIVSHVPEEVEELCERIIVLKNGTIFSDSSLDNVKKEYKSVRKFLEKFYEDV